MHLCTVHKRIFLHALTCFVFLFTISCRKNSNGITRTCNDSGNTGKPNIIFILADDVGYEIPTYTGGHSYETPTIDSLAASGMQFTKCYATPNCSPTRVMMLTGKYNFRNYTEWGHLNNDQKTFVNMLHDNGYFTCVAGKWQLDGGEQSVHNFGFDDYMLWNPFNDDVKGKEMDEGRYKNPKIYQNGNYLSANETDGKYADDMFTDFIVNFIDNHTQCPFFIYYPMSLCHQPFSPTPDDAAFASWNPQAQISDPFYFPSMVKYMDKKVKQIVDKIKEDSLENNTYIFFTGDNGTDSITSQFNNKIVTGGKGTTTEFGTHVPLFISSSTKIIPGTINNNLIDFTDFFKSIADIANISSTSFSGYGVLDGNSFAPQLSGDNSGARSWIYCYWKPEIRSNSGKFQIYAQTATYKLYDQNTNSNNFYNLFSDSLEQYPISPSALTLDQLVVKQQLQQVIDEMHN